MRLLQRADDGGLSLTNDLGDDGIPRRYAILSHTWIHGEEVTFNDFIGGAGREKAGYKKIRFCGEQAARDGIRFFWIDTCCIDKSNHVELQYAVNSMFRYYRNAAKCYVYLPDVSQQPSDSDQTLPHPWESAFLRSRWFTRGWTLQELLAPKNVEFFSENDEHLGSKMSLERQIREATGIPVKALRGETPLSEFSVVERISWAEKRETKYPEDKAYSLLGLLGVFMPLNYGEGEGNAFRRLRNEIKSATQGNERDEFSITFSLSDVSETENFVARESELTEMHSILGSDGSSNRRIAILHGLGGIGKTQLSISYAKKYRDSYSAMFWLNVKDEDSLKQGFAKIANRILRQHPSAKRLSDIDVGGNLDLVIHAVKEWLSLPDNTRWLLVCDNYDNPKVPGNNDPAAVDIRKYLPEAFQGSIIITSRSAQVTVGRRVHIKKLEDMDDCIKILSNTSRRHNIESDSDAMELVRELDGLPLALATAGAYLDQAPAASFSDYLRLYRASWLKLQQKSPELSTYEDRMLYSTWQISYNQVKERNLQSAYLLQLWAYFDNQDIWLGLLQHNEPDDPEWFRRLTEDELSFNEAIGVLHSHGLIEACTQHGSGGYSLHSCVHAWTIHVLNQPWDDTLARIALSCVASQIYNMGETERWTVSRRFLQHASRCSHFIENSMVKVDGMEWAMHNLGYIFTDYDKLEDAEKMFQLALRGNERAFGLEHEKTLNTKSCLAHVYFKQGMIEDAERMFEQVRQAREKILGPSHVLTLEAILHLANASLALGKLENIEKLAQSVWREHKEVLGSQTTEALRIGFIFARLLSMGGMKSEAEEVYQQLLQGFEKILGSEAVVTYPPALEASESLALLLAEAGRVDEARDLFAHAQHGFGLVFGQSSVDYRRVSAKLARLALDPIDG